MGPKLILAFALVAIMLGALACSSSPEPSSSDTSTSLPPTPPPTPSPSPTPINPQALLEESGRLMEGLTSFHFYLEHESGNTPLLPNLAIEEAEGDVVKPDRLSTDFNGVFGGFAIKSSLITIGDDSYMTNPFTGEWEGVPREVSPLGFFNPSQGIASMMAQIEPTGIELNDKGVHRITGRLPAEALAPLLGGTVKGAIVDVQLEIDVKTLYLRKAIFEGRVTKLEPDGVVRVITLSRLNEPLVIEAPQ